MGNTYNIQELPETFKNKSEETKSGCWIWSGASDRYGTYWDQSNKKLTKAHIFSYTYFVGSVPKGFELDHLCREKLCVNPAHLEAVTHAENVRRGHLRKVWGDRKECSKGHKYTDSTKVTNGRRVCKVCQKATQKKYRRSKGQKAVSSSLYCKKGHKMFGTSLYFVKDKRYPERGVRACNLCRKETQRNRKK